MAGFSPSEIIDNPKLLFGRSLLLNQILSNIKRNSNSFILGERRFGKTSLLRCLRSVIKHDQISSMIPVYLCFKEHSKSINGANDFYRFIIASCFIELFQNGILTKRYSIKGISIKPKSDVWEIVKRLKKLEDYSMQGILEDFILTLSKEIDRTFVLLFDEYEYMFQETLKDNAAAFFVLRSITEKPREANMKPLVVILAGAKSREKVASLIGSPELNNMGCYDFILSPLKLEHFQEMWNYYLDKIDDSPQKDLLSDPQYYYNLSGGVPYYAKYLGETVLTQNRQLDYFVLKSEFLNLIQNLDQDEVLLIKNIANGIDTKSRKAKVNRLIERGFVFLDNGIPKINGQLFLNFFIAELMQNEILEPTFSITLKSNINIVEQLITDINDESINKLNKTIFEVTNDAFKNYEILRKVCEVKSDLNGLGDSLYQILFERTAEIVFNNGKNERKTLKRLPKGFKREHDFINIIDSFRQNFGAHSTSLSTFSPSRSQLSKGDLLTKLLGTPNEPEDTDCKILQKELIEAFINYLTDLKDFVHCRSSW